LWAKNTKYSLSITIPLLLPRGQWRGRRVRGSGAFSLLEINTGKEEFLYKSIRFKDIREHLLQKAVEVRKWDISMELFQ
jgi:hypothetical protein